MRVVRADFRKEVTCKPESKQWVEVSQGRGELVERKLQTEIGIQDLREAGGGLER